MPEIRTRSRWKRSVKRWLRPARLGASLAVCIALVLAVLPAISLVGETVMGEWLPGRGTFDRSLFNQGLLNEGLLNQGLLNEGLLNEGPSNLDIEGNGAASTRLQQSMIALPDAPSGALELLLRSFSWALAASIVATCAVWGAARIVRRETATAGREAATVAILVPLVLPPWLLFAAIWLSVGPGTWIGDIAERADQVSLVRMAALFLATSTWAMAPAFGALMLLGSRRPTRDEALLALDDANIFVRLRAAIARDARGLAAAVALPSVFLLSETTVYDLALVPTYGFEVRAREALGAQPAELVTVAWPVMLAALACVVFALKQLSSDRARALRDRGTFELAEPTGRSAAWLAFTALPSVFLSTLFLSALRSTPRPGDFLRLHGASAWSSLSIAMAAAAIVAIFAVSLRLAMDGRRREPTQIGFRLAMFAAAATSFVSLIPGTVLAAALESAYNRAATAWIYDSSAILVLILAARASLVGVLIACASYLCEPESAARLRALDGDGIRAAWRTHRHALAAIAGAAFVVGFAWSLGELTASGRVAPPGVPWLATDMLNAIHYQRPETVLLGAVALIVVAWFGAFVLTRTLRMTTLRARTFERMDPTGSQGGGRAVRSVHRGWLLLAALVTTCVALPACSEREVARASSATNLAGDPDPPGFDRDAPRVDRRLEVTRALEGVGRGKGQFNGPRALATDPTNGEIYVIDKDARVQRFSADGTQLREWRMPKKDRGKPVGATVAPDGSLVVADTHEHRIVAYSPDGEVRWMLGEYGREHGQFIYPTDIAFAPDGRMFIAEYGGNDRIQVFDAARRFLYAFGRSGSGPVEFLRPQALALDATRDELYIVDAGNHRVQVVTTDGEFRREIGGTGREEGRFAYPFGIVLLIDGVPVTSRSGMDAFETSVSRTRDDTRDGHLGDDTHEDERPREIIVIEHSNHRLQRLDARTGEVRAVAGGIGREPGRLKYPWAVDAAGVGPDGTPLLAVCDQGNSRIVVFPLP